MNSLTEREREVLEAICLHKNLQLQQIARKGFIRKEDGKPIKVGTLKAYSQKLYDKLGIESRDRLGIERDYCPLIEKGESGRPETRNLLLTKNHPLLFGSFAAVVLVILALIIVRNRMDKPLPCENLNIAKELFPQLEGVLILEPFSNSEESTVFNCEGVQDIVHNATLSVHLTFEDEGTADQFGYFGVGGFNGYDVSNYNELCFNVYAREPGQSFWVNLKDMNSAPGFDTRIPVSVPATFSWEEICVQLQEYKNKNEELDLSQLENVNLGFDNRTGTAEIWVSGFEFR